MFRLAVARTREIVRTEGEIARLVAKPEPTAQDAANLAAAQSSLEALRGQQTGTPGQAGRLFALQGACAAEASSLPSCRPRCAPAKAITR